ncbi:MAG: AraC family transcriptional regulator [Paracoccus sp. (in: a-proteobacteria)]|uniref:helix-turn-helix transcriptional regulator n=1 Tax=Paracoccus sp. TaxID=267 RepID=UPI0026DF65F2|nr:AraC family transcriptional regulator [Paracoccus sp. (in: a-proteobacteria)]MDO5631554.1 AraC family transcriptional regulator [Paracoccus sp. (in: a-proteobacteria)]
MAMHTPGAGRIFSGGGWPFTPSRFKGLTQSGVSLPAEQVGSGRLARANITAGYIPEGRALYPRAVPAAVVPPETNADHDSMAAVLPVQDRPLAQHPVPRLNGLRLLPLEGFIWGARSTPPQPRTRVDHVLIWVTGGALQLDFPRRRLILGPGSVQFLPAGTGFATLPLGQARGHVLLFGADLCTDLTPALPSHPVLGSIGDEAHALQVTLSDLAVETARDTADARAAVTCHLGLLAVRLSRLDPPARQPAALTHSLPNLPLVDRFMQLAAGELGGGRTIGELADALGVSTATLDRACRQTRGRRAIELIHDLRHETAVHLLRDTRQPLTEISRDLGYTGLAHFTRAFVARTGRLPHSFRRPDAEPDSAG